MSRLLIIFLLLVLPLQASWAAVVCTYNVQFNTALFKQNSVTQKIVTAQDTTANIVLKHTFILSNEQLDNFSCDCDICHCPAVPPSSYSALRIPLDWHHIIIATWEFTSHIPNTITKPNWLVTL